MDSLDQFGNKLESIPRTMQDGLRSILSAAMMDVLQILARTASNNVRNSNRKSELYTPTGKLERELLRSDDPSTRNVTVRGTVYEGIFGASLKRVPYAIIREKGGFIKASPVTVIREFLQTERKYSKNIRKRMIYARETAGGRIKPFQTYQMARFMWAKFFETKNDAWKRMAISVHKKGGVNIKPNPYILPALLDSSTLLRCRELIKSRLAVGLADKLKLRLSSGGVQ